MENDQGSVLIENEPFEEPTRKRKLWAWLTGGVLVVALLGGAAFATGQLLNKPKNGTAGNGSGMVISSSGGPGGGGTTRSISFESAPELPERQADANGVFVKRDDNSVFVGTGNVTIGITQRDDSSKGEVNTNYDGPVVEVVVTNQTTVYKDTTDFNPGQMPEGENTVQQTVAPGDLDEIGENAVITAWGRKVGDRLIADMMVYQMPFGLK